MTIKVPALDDLGYADIVEDSTKRIPVYSPGWTDHNASDPGITILEMLAWIAESKVFELDQLTERHRLKFLKLMGALPRPQQCAAVDLTFKLPESIVMESVPSGTLMTTRDESGNSVLFSTDRDLIVTHAEVESVISVHSAGMQDNTSANSAAGIFFHPFGAGAKSGSSMYVGFNEDRPPLPYGVDTLSIYIKTYDDNLPAPSSHGDEAADVKTSVKVEWQYCPAPGGAWIPFEVADDTTRMLQQGGVVVLKRPPHWEPGTLFGAKKWWIRCVMTQEGYEVPPQVDSISVNGVSATQIARMDGDVLAREADGTVFDSGVCSGLPGQRFFFPHRPVVDACIWVGGEEWKEVDDLDGSGPDDAHYAFDHAKGEATFGDGINGKVPPAGMEIKAAPYRIGGGVTGNVKAHSRWAFADPDFESAIDNPDRAKGGADGETYRQALARLKGDMKVPYAAVTEDDYRYIAVHTPGLRFGRAKAIKARSGVEGCEALSNVKVIVVPYSTLDNPVPSQGFLDTVREHLEKHRLITTGLEVSGPDYAGITVRAAVRVKQGYSQEGRRKEIEMALADFLHPLKGGDKGEGWPFGRTVYRSEVYETIEGVEGVDCVSSVLLYSTGGTQDDDGNVAIGENALVYLASLVLDIAGRDSPCLGR